MSEVLGSEVDVCELSISSPVIGQLKPNSCSHWFKTSTRVTISVGCGSHLFQQVVRKHGMDNVTIRCMLNIRGCQWNTFDCIKIVHGRGPRGSDAFPSYVYSRGQSNSCSKCHSSHNTLPPISYLKVKIPLRTRAHRLAKS